MLELNIKNTKNVVVEVQATSVYSQVVTTYKNQGVHFSALLYHDS